MFTCSDWSYKNSCSLCGNIWKHLVCEGWIKYCTPYRAKVKKCKVLTLMFLFERYNLLWTTWNQFATWNQLRSDPKMNENKIRWTFIVSPLFLNNMKCIPHFSFYEIIIDYLCESFLKFYLNRCIQFSATIYARMVLQRIYTEMSPLYTRRLQHFEQWWDTD